MSHILLMISSQNDSSRSLFSLGIGIISFGAPKLKLIGRYAQLTGLPTVILDFRGLKSINW